MVINIMLLIAATSCEEGKAPTPEDILVGHWAVYEPIPKNPTSIEFGHNGVIKISQSINGEKMCKTGVWKLNYSIITIQLPDDSYKIHIEQLGRKELWFHDRNQVLNKAMRVGRSNY